MRNKRYSLEQIVAAVQRHEAGIWAAHVSRKPGI